MPATSFTPLFNFLQLFKEIPQKDIDVIGEQLSFKEVDADTELLHEGNIAKEMFFICKGILKIVSINEKGNSVTQFFLKENQFCTILNSFTNNVPAHESIITACDCELIVLAKEKLHSLYNLLPYLKELIDSITHQTLMEKIATRNAYMGEDATTRYLKFIQRQPDIALRVPLSDVA